MIEIIGEKMSNDIAKKLDQFYTNIEIAKKCINETKKKYIFSKYLVIEPSAGTGSFSDNIQNVLAFDIDPKKKYIIKQNFLNIKNKELIDKAKNKPILIIGNPPFGKNSSLAINFFNKSAEFANVISFIIPKTFRKKSVQKRLNLNFHLIKDIDIPKNSFIHKDKEHDVPCCFQIWEKKEFKRKVVEKLTCDLFDFVKKEEATFAVRRVGGRAGRAFFDVKDLSTSSNYFLKEKNGYKKEYIVKLINSISFLDIVSSTVGVRSLSKGEFIEEISKKITGGV